MLQHARYSASSILTILEVVVSICWVAISIDMTGVTATDPQTLLLLHAESPLDERPNKVEPKVRRISGDLFHPLVS